jgi:hypothetical protein
VGGLDAKESADGGVTRLIGTPLRDHATRLVDVHLAGRGSIQIDELAERFPCIPRIRLAAAMVRLVISRQLRGVGNPRFEYREKR